MGGASTPGEAMLTLADVQAGYGSVRVLHSVALEVSAGECTAVLGRNGVGKSTLLRCIAGLLPLQRGSISIDGSDVSSLSAFRRARLGVSHVPQGRGIFGGLTVRENLRVGPAAQRPADAAATTGRLLEDFPTLATMANSKAAGLSGGQQQLLALARALATEPRLLLLDEPSEGIQPSILDEIAAVLARARAERHIALVLVEQNLDFAARLAETAHVMVKGELVAKVATAELAADRDLQRRYMAI
ncbi:MAG: ATP-binding cassette domain-containing protein [bacterium]|nr:ATP-binding cassette domain-containing protein [bacterium]